MALQLTDNERLELGLKGLRARSMTSPPTGKTFDGIWAGRDEQGQPIIRGWVNVMALEEGGVAAMVLNPGAWEPELKRIPNEEIVWFLRGPRPPGLAAGIAERDPILNLPGEKQAYRLRRILRLPPHDILQPEEMLARQPEFSLQPVLRSPNNDLMAFGLMGTGRLSPSGIRFIVEYEGNMKIRQASAAFSLLWWHMQMPGTGRRLFDWGNLRNFWNSEIQPFQDFFLAYQALRLPGLRLALEYRASPMDTKSFIRAFADTHLLPLPLVATRLEFLRIHRGAVALF